MRASGTWLGADTLLRGVAEASLALGDALAQELR
jgi:hypothetical protein